MALNPRDPVFQRTLFVAIVLAGVLYANFFTDVVPFTYRACAAEAGELEDQYRDLSKDLNKARQAAHRLPYLEKEYVLLHRKWEQSQSLLPSEQDQAWCLRSISRLGAQAGVEFALFKPLAPRPAQYYTEHPIEVKVLGGYHEVGTFLNDIANLDRVINVTNLEVKTPKSGPESKEYPAEASFVAVTYVLGGTGVPTVEETDPVKKAGAKSTKAFKGNTKDGGRPTGAGEGEGE